MVASGPMVDRGWKRLFDEPIPRHPAVLELRAISKLSEPKRNQLLPSWFIWRAASSVGRGQWPWTRKNL